MKLAALLTMEAAAPEDVLHNGTPLANIDPVDIPKPAQKLLTPTLEEDEKEDDDETTEFPDITTPDNLNMSLVTDAQAHESKLAKSHINAITETLEAIKNNSSISDTSIQVIGTQLSSIAQYHPESRAQAERFISKSLSSSTPMAVESVMESLLQTMASLRPVVNRGLNILINTDAYVQKELNIPFLKGLLQTATVARNRSDKDTSDPDTGERKEVKDFGNLFPEIVKSIRAGHEPTEVHNLLNQELMDGTKVPMTAVVAISKGIKKLPLSKDALISGPEISVWVGAAESTIKAQAALTELLSSFKQVAANPQGTLAGITAAMTPAFEAFNATVSEPPATSYDFQVLSGAQLDENDIPGYGVIIPKDLSDVADAIQTKLMPSLNAIKAAAKTSADTGNDIMTAMNGIMRDEVQLSEPDGVAFQDTVTKLLDASSLVYSKVHGVVSSSVDLCFSVCEIARGVGIIAEMD